MWGCSALFPSDAIHIAGAPGVYTGVADSGNQVRRRFCAACGSHLFADNTGCPGLTAVRLGTFDAPGSLRPQANIWTSSAPTWACLDSALQAFDQQPQMAAPPPASR